MFGDGVVGDLIVDINVADGVDVFNDVGDGGVDVCVIVDVDIDVVVGGESLFLMLL